ncbi:MAG: hypothetical protein R3308_09030, partial [Thiohalobacterales bacterium]|nr:hypothetical protein [Thiohalobacterales bacterium]
LARLAHGLQSGEMNERLRPEPGQSTLESRTVGDVDLSDIEFDSHTGEGAVIVNWGTVLTGKLMILMAGSPAYQEALAVELDARLC